MSSYSEPLPKISLTRLLLVLVAFGGLIWWTVGWSVNNDPLWFWSRFDERPASITLYYRGQRVEFQPGQRGFDELTRAFNEAFSGRQGWTSLGVSPESANDYRQREVALAFHYNQPIRIHSRDRYGPYRGLFLPLTGRHSEVRPVWGLDGEQVVSGAMLLGTVEPVVRVLRELGYPL